MTAAIVFDDNLGRLAPLTDLRAAFEIRTGAFTTFDRLWRFLGARPAAVYAPAGVAAIVAARWDGPVNELPPGDDLLLVSGRCVLPPVSLKGLPPGAALVEADSGDVIGARFSRAGAAAFLASGALAPEMKRTQHAGRCLLRDPEDIIRFRDAAISIDLGALAPPRDDDSLAGFGVVRMGEHPVVIDESAEICPMVVLDAEKGPIVIAEGAVVRPGAIISGPAYIGRAATVLDRAHIKANTVIGPSCKVGGEIGGVIFQGFANKSHDGHLGDSYVGEWANLGAGTTNSNLLNTYGEVVVRSEPGAQRRRTGLVFLGCIIGDHCKLAIGTRIMTGSIFGTGAMIASSTPPPTAVGRFAWLTDAGEQRFRLDKFLETAEKVMARRGMRPDAPTVERLRALHAAPAGPATDR